MDGKFFNPVEALSRDEICDLQLKRLRAQVGYLSNHSPYYGRLFKEEGITQQTFQSLDDLKRVPFTDKYIVAKSQERQPPFGEFLCVPEARIIKYFRTSGTTLKPRNFCYTADDWMDITVEVMARMKYSTGIRPEDRVFIAFPYSTFISLWTSHYASEKIGCMVIPGGGLSSKERLRLMKDMKVTVLCSTPTYAFRLANVAEEEGIDLGEIPLRLLHTGGEPLAAVPGSRARLETIWDAKAFDQYGASEGSAPAGGECEEQDGLHFTEDVIIPEVLNESGERVEPGGRGELVMSNVFSRTMPLLRFKTGDVVTYVDKPCPCGRQSIRIKVIGRTDDMIVIKGTNLFPSMIEEMVKRCPELSSDFMILIEEINGVYELIIQIEPRTGRKLAKAEETAVAERLVDMVRENVRLRPVVRLMEAGSLPRFEVKSKRVVDKRPEIQ